LQKLQQLFAHRLVFKAEFTVGQLLRFLAVVLVVAYTAWEVYWYTKIGLLFIHWHTHIAFAALVAAAVVLPFWIWHKKQPSPAAKNRLLTATTLGILIVLLETLLVLTGLTKVYMETRGGYFQSPYLYDSLNYYHLNHPSVTKNLSTPEFTYERSYNRLGYSGAEWDTAKPTNVKRIVTLGDSFTEGDGAPADSTYPALLEEILLDRGQAAEVLNAGICGSDPVFSYKNITDRVLAFAPDVVVVTVHENDIYYDMPIRGGLERFVSDSIVHYKPAPRWEPLYAISYLSRLVFHALDMNLSVPVPPKQRPAYNQATTQVLTDIFTRLDSLGRAHNFEVVVVQLPLHKKIEDTPYEFDFALLQKNLAPLTCLSMLDLHPCYAATIAKDQQPLSAYFWKDDGHHNSTGYRLMAGCIADHLQQRHPHWPVYKNQP
jgi:lysophospholipase L1-like esterase